MKARTLVLMLCIGLMCSTGFGITTADLTDNSNTEIVQADDAVSVVVLEVESMEVEAPEFDSISNKIFTGSPDLISRVNQNIEVANTITNPDTIEGDVGWQFNSENYKLPKLVSYHRNPRDGISYDFLS